MEIQESVLLRRVGRMDPVSVPEFEALGGFSGIRKALSMEKEEILEEISRSNLKGRGGAGYPAGRKWKAYTGSKGIQSILYAMRTKESPAPLRTGCCWKKRP